MRNAHRCPKCDHRKILYLPWLSDRTPAPIEKLAGGTTQIFPLAIFIDQLAGTRHGQLEAYVCQACGYTELYTQEPGKLPIDKIPGAKILEGPEGTYR